MILHFKLWNIFSYIQNQRDEKISCSVYNFRRADLFFAFLRLPEKMIEINKITESTDARVVISELLAQRFYLDIRRVMS